MPRRRDGWLGELPPGRFPHADSACLCDAPAACPRCGGPWQRCDEGLWCLTCGKRWRTEESLRALVGRQYHAEAIATLKMPGMRRRR